ncbi:MAG: multiheme c-type cytochrome [Bryobacteraceae bacterium]|jgi:hypothetical protein
MKLLLAVLSVPAAWAAADDWSLPRSAESCGDCHRTGFAIWNSSRHARALDSRLFRDTMRFTGLDYGDEAGRSCLSCHAPLAGPGNDPELRLKATWEGVTCDYCHSVREVSLAAANAVAKLTFNAEKTGPPWMKPDPRQHGTASVDVLAKSEFCALCHQYQNALGFPVITTFAEWGASRYAKEGRQCQSCHMSSVAHGDLSKRVATQPLDKEWHDSHCDFCHGVHIGEDVKRPAQAVAAAKTTPPPDRLSWHGLEGGSSVSRLTKAISVQMTGAREGGKLKVNVEVANTGAGHHLPSGSPMRQLILEVNAETDGGAHFSAQRSYCRTFSDRHAKRLDQEYKVFVEGNQIIEDTRLAPDEKRTETFLFDVPLGAATMVNATLWYFYSPLGKTDSQMRTAVLSLKSRFR